jgi:hypothetical protein
MDPGPMRRISWRKRKKKKKPLEKIWGKLSDPKNGYFWGYD